MPVRKPPMLNPWGLLRIGGKSAGTIIVAVSQFAGKMGRAITDLLWRSRRLNPPCVGLWITTGHRSLIRSQVFSRDLHAQHARNVLVLTIVPLLVGEPLQAGSVGPHPGNPVVALHERAALQGIDSQVAHIDENSSVALREHTK